MVIPSKIVYEIILNYSTQGFAPFTTSFHVKWLQNRNAYNFS